MQSIGRGEVRMYSRKRKKASITPLDVSVYKYVLRYSFIYMSSKYWWLSPASQLDHHDSLKPPVVP